MLKPFRWLDDHLLPIFAGFLLVFIPLYPKIPFADALPGYIVRIRLEDILVAVCLFIWFIYLLRKKVTLSDNPLIKWIGFYLIVGLLSVVSAIFVIKTIPLQFVHVGKALLHFFRRVEYFSLFFVFYTSIKNLRQIKSYLLLLITTVMAVSVYGFGQKYLYWPAFSTMNREFAKGWQLYLTEHARVLSTFGGHYDLAAFIMMALIILWSLFFGIKKILTKLLVLVVIAAAFWTLILTASRTSFIAYIVGLTLMFFFWAYKKGIFWSISRFFLVSFLSITIMLSFGDLSERFTKLLKIDQRLSGIKSLLTSPFGKPPTDKAYFLVNNSQEALSEITSKSDQPPKLAHPSDVYQDMPLKILQGGTISARPRTYSQTAFKYDLSTAIRFDALWPMAIKGFLRNPVLGSGYSTLNKTQVTDFTEAESTDNDFLRSLGETGILGFAAFYGTLIFILYYLWRNLELFADPLIFAFTAGFAGLVLGLLVNAVYIDVFESSKVAFSFWALTGIVLSSIKILKKKQQKINRPQIPRLAKNIKLIRKKTVEFLKSDRFFLSLLLILALVLRLYKIKTPLADWHSWRQADTASVSRNYVKHGINLLYPTYDDLSNVASGKDNPKGLRFVEFPLYNLAHVVIDSTLVGYDLEIKGRLTSALFSLLTIVFLFLLVRKYSGRLAGYLTAFFFAVIPYNIFYSRVILPEPLLVAASTGMIYFFDRWLDLKNTGRKNNFLYLFLSLFFTAAAVLTKPYAVFLFLPMIYLYLRQEKINLKSVTFLAVFFLVSLLPFFWWRWWAAHFPEGIPANIWLLNGDGIRFKGSFFFWLFADRLGRLILGFYGLPLLILGIMAKKGKEGWLYHFWGLAIVLYVTVFATGNVRHDYYQILVIPIITIYLAKGVINIYQSARNFSGRIKNLVLILVLIIFMEMFGWYYIRDYYNINHPEIVEAGQAVERKTPSASLVIAPYNGDTAFLYQTRRAGWPIMEKSIDEMIKMGAQYYVSVNFDTLTKQLINEAVTTDPAKKKYKLVDLTADYVIIQLVPDNKLSR